MGRCVIYAWMDRYVCLDVNVVASVLQIRFMYAWNHEIHAYIQTGIHTYTHMHICQNGVTAVTPGVPNALENQVGQSYATWLDTLCDDWLFVPTPTEMF